MLELTDHSYDEVVKKHHYVVIVFDAKWNILCNEKMKNVVGDAVQRAGGGIIFAVVDVDLCPKIAKDMNILNVPTVVYYRSGVPVMIKVGFGQNVAECIDRLRTEM